MNLRNKLKNSVIPILVAGMFISTNAFAQNNFSKKDTIIFSYKISENYFGNRYEVDTSNHELDVVEYGKSIIEKLTNKPFSSEISILKITSPDEGSSYSPYDKKISLNSTGTYTKKLVDLMHEFGHAFDPKQRALPENLEENIRDEALALILEFSTPYLIENKKLREEVLEYLKGVRYELEYGQYSHSNQFQKELHLADAIITYFNDPIKAYNYLANKTYEEIDPEILEMFEKNEK